MATAEELLAGVTTVDKTLVISNDLRTISIPPTVANLGVESDNDILRLKFKMPRYIGDIDLSAFSIRINYVNAQGESDVYTVSDATTTADYISFSWLVGPTATRYKGETKFNVCLVTLTSDGYVDREFNTTVATMKVLEGLEVDESLVEEYSDLIEQWRRELFGIGDTEEANIKAASQAEQEAIAAKGAEVLATIPVDYQTAVSMTDNADRTKADAIVCPTQGETITVFDSSDDYLRGLKIFGKTTQVTTTGKNLFNNTAETDTVNGIEFAINTDRSVTITGTATATTYFKLGTFVLDAGEYLLSGCANGSVSTYLLYFQKSVDSSGYTQCLSGDKSFTIEDSDERQMLIAVYSGVTVNTTIYPMIRHASITDATYEPYSGGISSPSPDYPQDLVSIENPTIDICGKNLLPNNISSTTTVNNGVTYTLNTDGSVTAVGTASPDADSLIYVVGQYDGFSLPKGTYAMNGIRGGSTDTYRMLVYQAGWKLIKNNYDGEVEFSLEKPTKVFVYYWIKRGTTVNTTFYPMIRLASVTDATYEPYKSQSLSIPTPNGLSGIPVTSGGNYTDSNGQQWICDEIDFERGAYVQRIATVTVDETSDVRMNSSDDPTINASPYRYYLNLDDIMVNSVAMCDRLIHKDSVAVVGNSPENMGVSTSDRWSCIYFNINQYMTEDTVDACKASLTQYPLTVRYVLAIPIETPLDQTELQAFRSAHTNFPNTTVLNDAGATMELKYNADTKTYLDNCFRPTDAQVQAAVDAWLTAHYANAEGVSF